MDFARWSEKTLNQYTDGAPYPTPAASIANLSVPSLDNVFFIQTNVSDLTVESSLSTLNDNGLSGRLEIWPTNYDPSLNSTLSGGNGSIYDTNDRPVISGSGSIYGSFQVHDLTNSRPVLIWNDHSSASAPDIGVGPSSCGNGHTDWTFCDGSTTNFQLQIFINRPITLTAAQLSFNSNNATSGSVPSTISGSGNVTIPANTGSLTRTGFAFSGWNTLANGSGTTYAVGSTFSLNSNTTLFARWLPLIVYDRNGNTTNSALVPTSQTILPSPSQNTLTTAVGLGRDGYTFGGWNTSANGSGVSYPSTNISLAGLPTPFLRLEAENFNTSTNQWVATNGTTRSSSSIRGTVSKVTSTSAAGTSATFPVVKGGTAAGITLTDARIPDYTFCSVARIPTPTTLNSTTAGGRLFDAAIGAGNWLSGYWAGYMNRFWKEGWFSQPNTANDGNFHLICDRKNSVRWDGSLSGTSGGTTTDLPQLTINNGNFTSPGGISSTEASDWEVAEVLIYNSTLSDSQVLQIEGYLKHRYGLTGAASAVAAPVAFTTFETSTGSTLYAQWNSVITYQSTGQTSGTVPANSTIPPIGGNLALNTGNLVLSGNNLIGWNTQSNGLGTRYPLGSPYTPTGNTTLHAQYATVTSFPTVAYNPTTLSVGAGVGGRSETFTATGGFGARTFSVSPVRSGFSIDTSTANGVALVVSPLVTNGTYLETITVTDAAGFSVNHVVTVTVAAPVRWSTDNSTSLTTTYGTAASTRLNITGGTTGRVVTLTKPTTVPLDGITIDTSTAITSNYVTLNVSTRVLPGTYSLTISVIDSSRIRSNQVFNVTVNKLPALSFTNGTAETTTVVRSGLHLQYEIGQSYSGSGTTVRDLSGNSRNGFIVSGTSYNPTLGGGSVTVNRSNYLQVNPGVIANSDSISRFYWIYPRSATQTLITVCNSGCGYIESELELSNSRLFARVWDLTSVSTQETLTLNTWHYVGYIYEGSTKRTSIYINGQLSASAISTGTRGAPSGDQFELMGYNTTTNMQTGLQGDYSLGSVHYYKRVLTDAEIFSNYAATAPRFLGTAFPGLSASGSATITTTQGVASSYSLFTATEGTGGKVITLSPVTAGVTLDTSTANSAILNIANTVTATNSTTQRTISTSVVATDSVTATTTYPLDIRINPPVLISATIPLTLTTTFGRIAYDTFTATQGTGNKTFTGVSSSFQSAFVVSNPSANVGLLTVANNLPVGTYLETITAIDSVGATTNYVLTVIVNAAPTIAGATGNTLTTTLARSATLRINVLGGTGTRTIEWSSPQAGITLDTSTLAAQNFITLTASSAVPVRTYSFSISATDSSSARVSDTFTVIVNRWPVIGSQSSVSSNLRLSLDAGDPMSYSGSGTGWSDLSGNAKNATWQVAPTYALDFGGVFTHASSANQYVTTPNLGTTDVFSVETWVRFDSLNTTGSGYPCVVTDDFLLGVINYSICFAGNNEIKGGYWRSASNKWAYTSGFTPVVGTWYHLVYTVNKSGSDYVSTLYQNGNVVGTPTTDSMAPGNSGGVTLIGKRWGAFTEYVNGRIPIVRVYNQALSRAEVIQNYNVQGSRFVLTNSGSETLTVTQGVAGSLSGVVASQGTGTKTLALSNINAGISIDTATANSFSLALANALTATSTTTARVLTETVTATDAAGATTTRVYSIVINPPIIETATSTSIATTSGVETTTVIYATQGTGNKTFTLTGASSGFTLTSAVNQATLRVLSTANPGTYNLTVTATDALGATTALPITVVVSPPPTLVGISRIETTRGVSFTSPLFGLSGGTGSLVVTVVNSPTNSSITLTGTTASGTFLLVGESSTVGTFLSTIRVTDARGSFSELIVTVVVNAPVTLSGALSITKTYGNSTTNGYSTNGTGTAPFSFSATPVCAVVKTVSGSFTYERINGTDSCTWTAPVGILTVDALLVGAGGGGGGDGGAGGGGGSINTLTAVSLPANRQLSVQVGAGGAGGVWSGNSSTAGGTTSLTSGSTTYTAPGGSAGGGCGAAAALGGVIGSGGTPTAGGNGGFGSTGAGCGGGAGSVGANGPSSSFTGSSIVYGGGGGGGVYPAVTTTVGPNAGGNGGGGAGAASKDFPSFGLIQYFRTFASTPTNATSKESFSTGACAVVTSNVNYTTDTDFPCSQKDNFQGWATGYFIAPVSGSITFYLSSDDSSDLVININGTNNELQLADCCRTVNATWSGFVAGQAYPINVYFTEIAGLAQWVLSYSYSGVSQTPIPISQLRSNSEGLVQYFRTSASAPASASSKQEFTTDTCSQRVSPIAYTTDSDFPCTQKDNFQGYATGFFVAPVTGSIKFYLSSDDSSQMSITVNGTTQEFGTSIGEASATYSGFVQGRYYPIKVFFTEISGVAAWKLDYEFSGQSRISIPAGRLRSTADLTNPTQGTNGLGGGGGGGTAGIHKLSGASGGSGTMILKYSNVSETATQTMITAIVNQQTPSGLLTLNVPAYVNVGTYYETITVQDAANSAPYQAVVTITINKATPTLALSLPGSVTTTKYGSPVTISATSPIPGRVAFLNGSDTITACSSVLANLGLATCSWTPTVVGSTNLRAVLTPTDTANYNSSSLVSLAITVAKADTFTVTVLSQTETFTGSAIVATRAFTTSGLAAIDSLTAISMLFTGTANDGNAYSSTTAPTNAGTYSIAPNYPTNAAAFTFAAGSLGTTSTITNYEGVAVVSGTLAVRRAPQVMSFTFANSNTVTYSPTATLVSTATTRLGTGTRTYSSTTPITCSISDTAVVTVLQAGSCSVQMAVALTANYEADTATRVITINKASRTFSLTPGVNTLKFADTTTVTATLSGGAADGTISYTLGSPAGCTFDPLSSVLVATSGTVQCPLSATISEGVNYLAETSTAMSLTIARANAPVISIDTVTARNHTPGVRALITPTFTITGLKNTDSANSLTYTYSFVSNPFETFVYADTRTPIDAGTYRITPSALTLSSGLLSNYETPTYSSSAINVVINRIAQETVTILSVNSEVEVPFTLIATGGSTSGAITFTKVSGANCSVTGTTLTATQAGSCMVTVTRAGNRNYLDFTSESVTVRVRNFVAVQIFVPSNPNTGITITPTVPLTKGPNVCTAGCVPKITSADVYDVAEGDLIVLTGINFIGVTKVYFNIYSEAPFFNVDSDTQLSVRVPADLPQGDATIEVVSPGGTSNRLFDFIILP